MYIPRLIVIFFSTLQLPALTGWIGRKLAMITVTKRHVKVLDSPRLRIQNWSNGGGSSIFIIVHLWLLAFRRTDRGVFTACFMSISLIYLIDVLLYLKSPVSSSNWFIYLFKFVLLFVNFCFVLRQKNLLFSVGILNHNCSEFVFDGFEQFRCGYIVFQFRIKMDHQIYDGNKARI